MTETQTQNSLRSFWWRRLGDGSKSVAFATSFRLKSTMDLTAIAKSLPEGVVICGSSIVAGIEHVEVILIQTHEYWKRNQKIARNGSIEILMRMACKAQISEAVEASHIDKTDSVALLGLVESVDTAQFVVEKFLTTIKPASQDISLLGLDRAKFISLKKFHQLPSKLSKAGLLVALQEKSVLLIFSR
jgi:tRNA threonylcarbamoyladenosine modification (KEOPS) complex Cgi121 subunit